MQLSSSSLHSIGGLKKILLMGCAGILSITLITTLNPPKAQAAWVNARPFDQYTLDLYCNALTNWGLNKGARNYGGGVSNWYCVITPPSWILPQGNKIWMTPGNACKYRYGSSYSFITTNYYANFGGYCAQWR